MNIILHFQESVDWSINLCEYLFHLQNIFANQDLHISETFIGTREQRRICIGGFE